MFCGTFYIYITLYFNQTVNSVIALAYDPIVQSGRDAEVRLLTNAFVGREFIMRLLLFAEEMLTENEERGTNK